MPGATFESDNDDFDSRDQSETLDDANLIGDGDQGEVRSFADADDRTTFEALPELMDMTRADGDGGGDEAPALDPGAATAEVAYSLADLEAHDVSDAELIDLGYAERKGGEVRAKPDD